MSTNVHGNRYGSAGQYSEAEVWAKVAEAYQAARAYLAQSAPTWAVAMPAECRRAEQVPEAYLWLSFFVVDSYTFQPGDYLLEQICYRAGAAMGFAERGQSAMALSCAQQVINLVAQEVC